MFEVPDWESDLPNPDLRLPKSKKRNNSDKLENLDEIFVNAKKKKLDEVFKLEDSEDTLFSEDHNTKLGGKHKKDINKNNEKHKQKNTKAKINVNFTEKTVNETVNRDKNIATKSVAIKVIKNNNRKKEKIKMLLEQSNRSFIRANGNTLRDKMMEKLKAAQFRFLNEKLYTASSNEANDIFKTDPEAFQMYHKGYQQQVKKWPVNPLDIIIKKILKMPKTHVIADMGCGEAALSRRVPHTVKSFDLVAANPSVVACNMAHTPLQRASVDVAVYCLALMGTELTQYLVEANRVLKLSGQLLIAEVESRFDNVESFAKEVEKLGFKLKSIDKQNSMFFFFHFVKNRDAPVKKAKMPTIKLKPCLYKKR